MKTCFSGKAWLFEDHVDTDMIIPSRFLITDDENELGRNAFKETRPEFASSVQKSDILVAGRNFGCGSSREHAPLAIRGAGISLILAESFARTFFRNCLNRGFLAIELPMATKRIREGDRIEVDIQAGTVENKTTGESYRFESIPGFMQEICEQGGLFEFIQKRLNEAAGQK